MTITMVGGENEGDNGDDNNIGHVHFITQVICICLYIYMLQSFTIPCIYTINTKVHYYRNKSP